MITHIEELEEIAAKIKAAEDGYDEIISVCTGTACIAVGSDKLLEADRKSVV